MTTDMMVLLEFTMTYTQPNTDIDLSIIPGEDSAVMAKKMQAAGQIQMFISKNYLNGLVVLI
jgi:hypothetical protein